MKSTDRYVFVSTFETIKKEDDGTTKLQHRLTSEYFDQDYGELVFQQKTQIGELTDKLLEAGQSMADAMGLGHKANGTLPPVIEEAPADELLVDGADVSDEEV